MTIRALAGLWLPGGSSTVGPDAISRQCRAMLAVLAATPASLVPAHAGLVLAAADYRARRGDAASASALSRQDTVAIGDLRLDNREELCRELNLAPDQSDDQILAAAWQRWSFNLVHHLTGGFAIACWDERTQTLFLARDHSGERPLHIARTIGSGGFAFASMPLALCALPAVGHQLDLPRLAHHLAVVAPTDSLTFFRGVERLLPGHWLKVNAAGVEIRRYWHPCDAKAISYQRDEDYIEDFRERFDRAVACRLSDAQGLASELSGGLDSSSVSSTAARLLAGRGERLTSFTAVPQPGFDGTALLGRFGDEGPAAAEVAALYPNIDHVLVNAAGADLVETAARAARLSGQPTFNPTNHLWLHAILDGMRARRLDVLLQGVTGNATISFGGLIGLSDLFRSLRWIALFRQARELRAAGYTSWRGAAAWATGAAVPEWVRRLYHPEMRHFSFAYSPVHPARAAEYQLPEKALATFYGVEESSASVRRQYYEYYDPGLPNGAAAAGWQIEQRDPTHDKNVYEFCFGIPIEQYLVGGQSRSLIRRAMQGRLPEATLRRTLRGLQSADWYLVIGAQRSRLAAELRRIAHSPMVQHVLDVPRLQHLLDTWPASGYQDPKIHESYHLALTRGIAAGSFIAQYDPEMPRD
ncbi:MAG: asparagine synthase, partial [Acidobacteriaceae bacterium]|nr:asparagine synthase [Acidobacteriaceae bacterium]